MINWGKCHFMVQEGIMLGHLISSRGLEVDKETTVRGIRSFFFGSC